MRFALDSRIYNLYLLINIDDKKEPQNRTPILGLGLYALFIAK